MKARTLVYLLCAYAAGYASYRVLTILAERESEPSMPPFSVVKQALDGAINDVTNAAADVISGIAQAVAIKNGQTNQVDLTPEVGQLNTLAANLRSTDLSQLLNTDDNLNQAVSTEDPEKGTVSPDATNSIPSQGQVVNPVQGGATVGGTPTDPATGQPVNLSAPSGPAQVGVSDQDNPTLGSPAPLGTQQPITPGFGAPTDAEVAANMAAQQDQAAGAATTEASNASDNTAAATATGDPTAPSNPGQGADPASTVGSVESANLADSPTESVPDTSSNLSDPAEGVKTPGIIDPNAPRG